MTRTNNKLVYSAGVLNIVLGMVLAIDSILIFIVAGVCLIMSFSLFFMAAVPAFIVTIIPGCITFGAAVTNIVVGVGAIIASRKSGVMTTALSAVSMIVDAAVIPANALAVLCASYLLYTEVGGLSITVFIIATLSILLAICSLVLNIIHFVNNKKARDAQ